MTTTDIKPEDPLLTAFTAATPAGAVKLATVSAITKYVLSELVVMPAIFSN